MFIKFRTLDFHETSCTGLIRLNAMITGIVNSFRPAALLGVNCGITLSNEDLMAGASYLLRFTEKTAKPRRKQGRVQLDSAKRYSPLLSIAGRHLLI